MTQSALSVTSYENNTEIGALERVQGQNAAKPIEFESRGNDLQEPSINPCMIGGFP